MTIASAYELKKQREYMKQREERLRNEAEKKENKKHEPKFNWNRTTRHLLKNVTFNDYLLDLLIADNGKLLKMYKRIKVNGKRLDTTGTGAMREITKSFKSAGGKDITDGAVRGKIRRMTNLYNRVSNYQFETGRGVDEDGLSVEEQMQRDCPRFKELSEILGDKCKPSPRTYHTNQSSKDLLTSNSTLNTTSSNTTETADVSPMPTTSVRRIVPESSIGRSRKGKEKAKLINDVVLGDLPQKSPVEIVAERYLGSSLSIQKKEASARLMIEHIEKHAKDIQEDPAETDRKVKEVIDDTFKQ
ncbi:hypothetical protein MBANPS3_012509 [Mucor bainieri]